GNRANDGGGVAATDGTLRIENSTIDNNTATNDGGGIDNEASTELVNVTITANRADFGGGGLVNHFDHTTSILNPTIADNHAASAAGIFHAFETIAGGGSPGVVTVTNSIVVETFAQFAGIPLTSGGHNVTDEPNGLNNPALGDLRGFGPVVLGPLADNGGPTP